MVQPNGLELNGVADDHSVCTKFKPSKLDHKEELDTIATIESIMLDIKSSMDQVQLRLNEAKTEFFYFGWPSQLRKCTVTSIDVSGETITGANITKYLGAHLDSALNFKQHIKTKCKAAFFNLQWINATKIFDQVSWQQTYGITSYISPRLCKCTTRRTPRL